MIVMWNMEVYTEAQRKKNRFGEILNHQEFPNDGQIAGYTRRGIVMTLSLFE